MATPQKKKEFTIERPALTKIGIIYNNYLSRFGCSGLHEIKNKYSRIDAMVHSGESTVIIEYKGRTGSICEYGSAIIERPKYEAMNELANALNCPGIYIMEYTQAILIYDLRSLVNLTWDTLKAQKNNHGGEDVDKQTAFIPYSLASFIISKKNWQRKSIDDLNYYLSVMK